MARPHPAIVNSAAVTGILTFFLGLYHVAQSIRLRTAYAPVEAQMIRKPAEIRFGGAPLKKLSSSYSVAYTFQVEGVRYSGQGTMHDQPRDERVEVRYLRSDPSNNTPEHPDYRLVEGGYWLLGSAALGAWFWLTRFRNVDWSRHS